MSNSAYRFLRTTWMATIVLLLASHLAAQQQRERQRPQGQRTEESGGGQDGAATREGGIPREMVDQQGGQSDEGTEDGMPRLRARPADPERRLARGALDAQPGRHLRHHREAQPHPATRAGDVEGRRRDRGVLAHTAKRMLHLNPSPLTSPTPPLPEGEEGRKRLSSSCLSPLSPSGREGLGE